jgi:hypothetical protein
MKCKFCGKENNDVSKLRSHMASHVQGYGEECLTVRQFLLCVQLFYGEIPSVTHIKEAIKDTEKIVDLLMAEMGLVQ